MIEELLVYTEDNDTKDLALKFSVVLTAMFIINLDR